MSVEALNAPQADVAAATPIDTVSPEVTISEDDALSAAFDRMARDNGAARENGRFASPNPKDEAAGGDTEPLEGGGGEDTDAVDPSTPSADVPLPSNWRGLEDVWEKVPAELRGAIKAHEDKLHQTLSQQGQALASFKPVGDVLQSYSDYFGGARGNYKPHEAIDYLFNLQRSMDDNPVQTLLQIADTYELRPHLAKMFGGTGDGQVQGGDSAVLLARIDQLETHLRNLNDPSRIDQRITSKLEETREMGAAQDVVSRIEKEMPLLSEVNPQDMVFFVQKSRERLGQTASMEAVFKLAGEMAINADPDLRKRAAAPQAAAASDPERIAAAKRANATNLRSTSTGRARELTQEEELGAVYDKYKG